MDELKDHPEEGHVEIGNGYWLYWKPNGVGGRRYFSDEIGGGVEVWDTSLVSEHTLLAALLHEKTMLLQEAQRAYASERTHSEIMLEVPSEYEPRPMTPWSD